MKSAKGWGVNWCFQPAEPGPEHLYPMIGAFWCRCNRVRTIAESGRRCTSSKATKWYRHAPELTRSTVYPFWARGSAEKWWRHRASRSQWWRQRKGLYDVWGMIIRRKVLHPWRGGQACYARVRTRSSISHGKNCSRDRANQMALSFRQTHLFSFIVGQMRVASHGNTPQGLVQPADIKSAGCCTSRHNSGRRALLP